MSSLPDWFGKVRQERMKMSQRQESRHAKREGGVVRPGSGNKPHAPQDVRTPHYLDQMKITAGSTFTIDVREWEKLRHDALMEDRIPRMFVEFADRARLVVTEE